MDFKESIYELEEIQQQMLELLDSADKILRHCPDRMAYERASAYWLSQIKIALTNDHEYVGGSMCSMEDTIAELKESPE